MLDHYDPLDIIGNGSFGIIRKVKRKSDGMLFARKELNFERMSERDRKQIVAEVNILKDLHHEHIVRYHDRFVDRDAGMLYILMEYCGGGDLSTVIKQAIKCDRLLPEDTIWNYFMQILLALHHCHHPNGHGRSGSGSSGTFDADGKEKRSQILHRDIKPDNGESERFILAPAFIPSLVFLDENNTVKLGDFGLSKALAQTSFANTYVGTPYYMSPELMQEKAYDSKSDIWSLGCLLYELCALKPPFHEAKTHTELSILIRNGRIPPLPKTYSQALAAIIKSMLSLNPAMRPSVAQLLQHERIEFAFKVAEAEKMLQTVKNHRATVAAREREVLARENTLSEKERQLSAVLAGKDSEISSLQQLVQCRGYSEEHVQSAIQTAISRREEELRVLVMKREEEVAVAMARREEEIIASVNKREADFCEAWAAREQQIRDEVDEKVQWVLRREVELREEEERLQSIKSSLEDRIKKLEHSKGRRDKTPLEEVKNILEPVTRLKSTVEDTSPPSVPGLATPIARPSTQLDCDMPSAMKGVVFTATGQALATPAPGDLAKLFVNSPKVGLNFAKIFEFEGETNGNNDDEVASPPPSPSARKEKQLQKVKEQADPSSSSQGSAALPPTRIRRPSIRTSTRRPTLNPVSSSQADSTGLSHSSPVVPPKPLPHPHLVQASTAPLPTRTAPAAPRYDSPEYDLLDEENLPSPFLKRAEREGRMLSKRPSNGNILRAVAAANVAGRRGPPEAGDNGTRPAVASARKASEEARKALQR